MERDCDECDWVEDTCLGSVRREYIRGMPCEEHGAVDTSQLASTFAKPPATECTDCGMGDLPLDASDRCWVCAELRLTVPMVSRSGRNGFVLVNGKPMEYEPVMRRFTAEDISEIFLVVVCVAFALFAIVQLFMHL